MGKDVRRTSIRWTAGILIAGGLSITLPAAGGYDVLQREILVVEIRPLTAPLAPSSTRTMPRLRIDPRQGGEVEFEVLWPEADTRCRIGLRAEQQTAPAMEEESADGAWTIRLWARAELEDGSKVRAERTLRLVDGTTALFEVYRIGERALTLALEGRREAETLVPVLPSVGRPVQFELEVQRVLEGRAVSLENNLLNTFVGEPVEYSFKLGEDADAARIRLRPLTVAGELIKIEVEISGTLPVDDSVQVVSRTEEWVATRDTSTTAAIESGEPPTGWRFLVTPRF